MKVADVISSQTKNFIPKYAVYQLGENIENQKKRFVSMVDLKKYQLNFNSSDYELVYVKRTKPYERINPEDIYATLNQELHPSDYYGYSLSISDIVVIYDGTKTKAYFCNTYGFEALSDDLFIGNSAIMEKFLTEIDIRKEKNLLSVIETPSPDVINRIKYLRKEYDMVFELADKRGVLFDAEKLAVINEYEKENSGDSFIQPITACYEQRISLNASVFNSHSAKELKQLINARYNEVLVDKDLSNNELSFDNLNILCAGDEVCLSDGQWLSIDLLQPIDHNDYQKMYNGYYIDYKNDSAVQYKVNFNLSDVCEINRVANKKTLTNNNLAYHKII